MVLRFEDLTIDDELAPMDRVSRYVSSSIALQRLVHVKMLSEVGAAVGEEVTINQILPLLPPLVADPESIIRQHVAMQLLSLAFACMGYTASTTEQPDSPQSQYIHPDNSSNNSKYRYCYKAVIESILPHLSKLISDSDGDVRQASAVSITGLVIHRIIRDDDTPSLILRIPLQLIHSGSSNITTTTSSQNNNNANNNKQQQQLLDKHADMRMTGAALLGDLSPSLSPSYIMKFVTPQLLILSKDPAMKVRRVVAGHSISKATTKAFPEDLSLRLFPAFCKLANDEHKYVRRASSEAMVDVSKACCSHTMEQLRLELIQLWKKMERDPVKAVKYAALQKLGQFIATLHNPNQKMDAAQELIPYFTGMAFIETSEAQEDASNRLHCAFSFPAVVHTFGKAGWAKLRDAYVYLSHGPEAELPGGKPNSNNASIKRCMACSIHEIAIIVGPSITEVDLVPIYEKFLKDPSEQVRFASLKNFHSFVGSVTDPSKRLALLSLVQEMLTTASPMNWRIRDCAASQLILLMTLFDSQSIRNKITPLVFKLLDDPVAEVREKTCSSIPFLLRKMFWKNICQSELGTYFASDQDVRNWSSMAHQEVLRVLKALPYMDDFSHRQTYCYICLCCASSQQTGRTTTLLESDDTSISTNTNVEEMEHHLKYILVKELIPLALVLKDDKVTNVRCLLRKCLRSMPKDIRGLSDVAKALKVLDMEEELWEDVSLIRQKPKFSRSSTSSVRSVASETTTTSNSSNNSATLIPQMVNVSRIATNKSAVAELTIIAEELSPSIPEPEETKINTTVEQIVIDEATRENENKSKESLAGGDEMPLSKGDDDDKSVSSIRSVSSWLSSSSRKSTNSQGSTGKRTIMFRKKKKENQNEAAAVEKKSSETEVIAEDLAKPSLIVTEAAFSLEREEQIIEATTAHHEQNSTPLLDENTTSEQQEINETVSMQSLDENYSAADNDDWSLSAASITSSSAWSISNQQESAEDATEQKNKISENLPEEDCDDNGSVASSSSRSVSSWISSSSLGKAIGLKSKEKRSKTREKRKSKTPSSTSSQETAGEVRPAHSENNKASASSIVSTTQSASSWTNGHSSTSSNKSDAQKVEEASRTDSETSKSGRDVVSIRSTFSGTLPSPPQRKDTRKSRMPDTLAQPEASIRQSGEIFGGEAENNDGDSSVGHSAYSSRVILTAAQRSVLIERKPLSELEEEEDLASLASI